MKTEEIQWVINNIEENLTTQELAEAKDLLLSYGILSLPELVEKFKNDVEKKKLNEAVALIILLAIYIYADYEDKDILPDENLYEMKYEKEETLDILYKLFDTFDDFHSVFSRWVMANKFTSAIIDYSFANKLQSVDEWCYIVCSDVKFKLWKEEKIISMSLQQMKVLKDNLEANIKSLEKFGEKARKEKDIEIYNY